MTTEGENLSASDAGDATVAPKGHDEAAGAIPLPQAEPTNGSQERADRAGALN